MRHRISLTGSGPSDLRGVASHSKEERSVWFSLHIPVLGVGCRRCCRGGSRALPRSSLNTGLYLKIPRALSGGWSCGWSGCRDPRLGDAAAPWEKGHRCSGQNHHIPLPFLKKTKKQTEQTKQPKRKEKSLKLFTLTCLGQVQHSVVGVSAPLSAAWAVSCQPSLPAGFWAQIFKY